MAYFKTAYLQRAVTMDVAVKGTVNVDDASNSALAKAFALRHDSPEALTAIKVGDLVKYTAPTDTVVGYIERVLSLASATHIVAQSDMTMEYGHVPVENRDYRYFPMVNATTEENPTTLTAPVKKVNLYAITDKADVLIDASQEETA